MKISLWPTLLLALLAANVAVVSITVRLANCDGGPAVTPNYDTRAMRWDESRVIQARSDALGWGISARVLPGRASSGEVQLALSSREGAAIEGVILKMTLFHNAHPNHPQTVTMKTDSRGCASASIGLEQAGLYTIHVESDATAVRSRFVHDLEVQSITPASLSPQSAH